MDGWSEQKPHQCFRCKISGDTEPKFLQTNKNCWCWYLADEPGIWTHWLLLPLVTGLCDPVVGLQMVQNGQLWSMKLILMIHKVVCRSKHMARGLHHWKHMIYACGRWEECVRWLCWEKKRSMVRWLCCETEKKAKCVEERREREVSGCAVRKSGD